MANKGIGYNSRNFADIRTDLICEKTVLPRHI
jgi:hypothetical protein